MQHANLNHAIYGLNQITDALIILTDIPGVTLSSLGEIVYQYKPAYNL